MDFSKMFSCKWEDFVSAITGEVLMSFFVMAFIILLAIVVRLIYIKDDPLKERKGIKLVLEMAVEKLENFQHEIMGVRFDSLTGYFITLALFIMFSFIVGITGLPNPLTSLMVPLCMAICTFVLIHFTAMKKNKFKYFKRYIDPIPVFLPINLLSMWAPILSLTLRLFGNALAGYTFMTLCYNFFGYLSSLMFGAGPGSIAVAPFIAPLLHLYFDLFSGLIQTLVFIILSMIWISQEDSDEDRIEESLMKAQNESKKVKVNKKAIKKEKIKKEA